MTILKLDTLLGHKSVDLIELIVSSAATQQSSAVVCAKAMIALIKVEGSEAKAKAALKAAKVSDCTVKNAMQLVWAYDEVVAHGHANEAWFDQLLYVHAVEVRRAVAKVGAAKLAEWKMFAKSAKQNLVEFELIADTGMNKAERIAADTKKAEAEIAAKAKASKAPKAATEEEETAPPAAAPFGTDAATAPAAPVSPPATPAALASIETAKPGKGKKTAIEEFDMLVGHAEKFVSAVFPGADDITIETMKNRVAALMVVVDQAAKKRGEEVRKTA